MIIAYSLVIGCSLIHILCCGLPLIATIIGLGTTLGFITGGILENPLFASFEQFEIQIFIISGLMLALAFIFKFRAKKLNCCEKEEKNFCNKNEKLNNLFLKISSLLYLISILILATNKLFFT
jgi:hypothetical protein